MLWRDAWRVLAGRIEGLMRAAEYLSSIKAIVGNDSFGVVKNWITPGLKGLIAELRTFEGDFGSQLPPQARACLKGYIQSPPFTEESRRILENLWAIGATAAFRAEFEYLLQDADAEGRTRTELSFEHLRRKIVVHNAVRDEWREAFDVGEVRCEQLGAAHLLSHGIWAFKVDAKGARTDLVYPDLPLDTEMPTIERAARNLVLTEWKRVSDPKTLGDKAKQAREQTKLYASSALGGLELRHTRYIVLVTERHAEPLGDVQEGAVRFRHITIPVSPEVPSRASAERG